MKVTRYVSDYALGQMKNGFGQIGCNLHCAASNETTNEITIELPDPPLEIEGYWCERLPGDRKLCAGGNTCRYPESEDSCRPVTLVEKGTQ